MADRRNKQATAGSSTDTDDDLLLVDLFSLDETLLEPSPFRFLMGKRHIWSRGHTRFLNERGIWGIVS